MHTMSEWFQPLHGLFSAQHTPWNIFTHMSARSQEQQPPVQHIVSCTSKCLPCYNNVCCRTCLRAATISSCDHSTLSCRSPFAHSLFPLSIRLLVQNMIRMSSCLCFMFNVLVWHSGQRIDCLWMFRFRAADLTAERTYTELARNQLGPIPGYIIQWSIILNNAGGRSFASKSVASCQCPVMLFF